MNTRVSGRLIYVATLVAIVGVSGGVAMGSAILSPTAVAQTAGMYAGTNSAPNGYSTPTLSIANIPTGVTSCTTTPITEATSGKTVTMYLSDVTGGTACTAGDFAEMFNVSYSFSITSAQTDKFTITTSYGTTITTGFNSLSVTTGATGSPWTQNVDVYVDYGSPSMPAGGIDTLTLVIQ